MAAGSWLSLFSATFSALLAPCCGQHFQQIVLGNGVTCNMSTVYAGTDDTSLDCTGAINGNTDTHWYNTEAYNPNCVFTAKGASPAYWFLNLGQSRAIHRITIYYVQYDDGGPYNRDYTDYMMNVRVSVDGSEIFRYPGVTSRITNPTQITDNLPNTGQIIKVERTTPWRHNYLPICEVQVWDCKAGYWGDQCAKTCNRGCVDGTCNRDDGQCQCAPGWREPSCAVCDDSHYGQDCSRDCGRCTGGFPCHNITGRCPSCQPGYIPPLCQNSCPVRKYGQNCALSCGHCADNVTCHHVDGHCPDGCGSGYLGELCDIVCVAGLWGENCTESCGQCAGDGSCDRMTAECSAGCVAGWNGTVCQQKGCKPVGNFNSSLCVDCQAGWYGEQCNEPCNDGCAVDYQGKRPCDKDTGRCSAGCEDGWYGDQCRTECSQNCSPLKCDQDDGGCEGRLTAPGESSGSDAGVIAGGVVGAVVGIAAVTALVVFIVFRRRRSSKGSGTKDVDVAADLAHSNTLSPSQSPSMSADPSSTAAKAKKPKAQIKPFNHAETKDEEASGPAGHIYSNTAAVANLTATETSSQSAAGGNAASTSTGAGDRPAKPKTKPRAAPRPTAARGAGQVYENVPVPQGRGQTEKPPEPFPRQPTGGKNASNTQPEDDEDDDDDDVYNSEDLYGSFKSLSSAQLDAFQRYLIACLGSGELGDQFENLPKGMRHPHTIGLSEENKRKNRFKALCTYDFNRVVLRRPSGDNSSDYINATYIKGCQGDQQYIATQGPRANTIDDLWWMVWQEGITQIVMLANLQEDGKDKCEEYWPASGKSQTHGHMTVRGLEVRQRADFVTRSFLLKNNTTSEERHVTQYHYMAWPDHGVPLAASLVDYWRYVKGRTTSTVPLLVHCSAGVGRTGTFIALDIASEKESRGDDVNVNEIVTQLREQRALMVQSETQYKFLHEMILEAHTSRATRVSTGQFDDIFADTIQTNTSNSRIDSEFQMLKYMGQFSGKPKHTMATMPENRDRNMDALLDDDHVVYLSAHVRGRNQYINAVYLSSFHHRRGFVLTQLPIPNNTLIDFWRLVDGSHVTKIVSLGSDEEEKSAKNYCRYWPRGLGEVMSADPYTIIFKSGSQSGDSLWSYRLTLTSKSDDRPREVELLHYKNWAGEVPGDTSSLLQLVDTVKAMQTDDVTASAKGVKPKDVTTPIIVQCIDGAAKGGLFCALCDVISRVTYDDEVDVYLTAREVQRIRPQAVATQTQYRYLYHVAQAYIRHVGIYANSGVK